MFRLVNFHIHGHVQLVATSVSYAKGVAAAAGSKLAARTTSVSKKAVLTSLRCWTSGLASHAIINQRKSVSYHLRPGLQGGDHHDTESSCAEGAASR